MRRNMSTPHKEDKIKQNEKIPTLKSLTVNERRHIDLTENCSG